MQKQHRKKLASGVKEVQRGQHSIKRSMKQNVSWVHQLITENSIVLKSPPMLFHRNKKAKSEQKCILTSSCYWIGSTSLFSAMTHLEGQTPKIQKDHWMLVTHGRNSSKSLNMVNSDDLPVGNELFCQDNDIIGNI